MDTMTETLGAFWQLIPLLAIIVFAFIFIWGINRIAFDRLGLLSEHRLLRQTTVIVLAGISVVLAILVLPVGEETKGHLLSLLGLLLTAIIAMSSTTLASNAMAGLMLRSMRSFHTGDFVRIGSRREAFPRGGRAVWRANLRDRVRRWPGALPAGPGRGRRGGSRRCG